MIPSEALLTQWASVLTERLDLPGDLTLTAETRTAADDDRDFSDFPEDHFTVLVLTDPLGGGTAFFFLGADPSPEEALARLAGDLEDYLVMRSWGTPAHQCPNHPHPLRPTVVDGMAVWQCPNDPEHYTRAIL